MLQIDSPNYSDERRALEAAGRTVDRIRIHLNSIVRSTDREAKIDRSLVQQWVVELSLSAWDIVDAEQEPSSEWTNEDRWRIVFRVRREMEVFLNGSIPSFVTAFQAKRWIYRIEMAVCMSLSGARLEAHRRELLGKADPII